MTSGTPKLSISSEDLRYFFSIQAAEDTVASGRHQTMASALEVAVANMVRTGTLGGRAMDFRIRDLQVGTKAVEGNTEIVDYQ